MPYKPRIVERMPEWIYKLSEDDECLRDVLVEAWVAGQSADYAIRQRGDDVPRTCSEEFSAANKIMDSIRTGVVSRPMAAKRAAVALRKFGTARQCARLMERDGSPRFADEPVRRTPRRRP